MLSFCLSVYHNQVFMQRGPMTDTQCRPPYTREQCVEDAGATAILLASAAAGAVLLLFLGLCCRQD